MKVTRRQIVRRGLAGRCPNCGERTLFPPGRGFRVNRECSRCGLIFDRGDGFFLGPLVLNYGLTVFGFLALVVAGFALGTISSRTALIIAGAGIFVLPVLLYRMTWSWWLMVYFYFLPQKLLLNHDELDEDREA